MNVFFRQFAASIYRNIVREFGLEEKPTQPQLSSGWCQVASEWTTNSGTYVGTAFYRLAVIFFPHFAG